MDGYMINDRRPMYFDAKIELKKIYNLGLKAIRRRDENYINFLLLSLDELKSALKNKFKLNSHGLYVLKKEIEILRILLTTRLKKQKAEDIAHEKKRRKSTEPRN